MSTKRLCTLGLLLAAAILLSYIDSMIPVSAAVPGIRLGLANLAVLFVLQVFGFRSAALVSLLRVGIIAVLFQSGAAVVYSFAGAAFSLLIMTVCGRFHVFDLYGVSVAGALSHNLAQVACAVLIMNSSAIFYYLPFLLVSGTVSGIIIGILGAILVRRLSIYA